jgi:non-ribosomal peptide synthase protein (TIGR01720 family)
MGKSDEGDGGELFGMAKEGSGITVSPRNRRSYVFDITAQIVARTLQINWSYGTRLHYGSTVEQLADRFIGCIKALLKFSSSTMDANLSHFPEARLSRSELESLLAEID